MPDLYHTLLQYDLGHLCIVADLWGLELDAQNSDAAAEELSAALLDSEPVRETIDILPAEAQTALNALVESDGRMEWTAFARKFGDIREMGAAKRDRERPYLKPISSTETLFYHGLIARAFFDFGKGAQEFAYIPDDLLELMPEENLEVEGKGEPLGRPATPMEKSFEIPANDHLLDEATTYLAALRMNLEAGSLPPSLQEQAPALQKLLNTARIIKKNTLQPAAVKTFLEAPRTEALDLLNTAWFGSQTFDELRLLPGIICEGEWKNQPQVTREFLMDLIAAIPRGKWWSITAFVKAIKEKYPDFQRPAGDYDSWFIKREADGQYLRGFAYWDQVDGALVKYLIQLLHWLGKVDLASAEEDGAITAFRLATLAEKKEEKGKLIVSSSGKIAVSRNFSRAVRYQIGRFCKWEDQRKDDFIYSVSARSLKAANEQGLKAEQLLAMLVKYTNGNVPPAMVKALKRWEANGTEARVESLLVLRVSQPEIMEELRRSKAGKYLGEVLSPTAVVVKSGAIQKVMAELTELGLLAEVNLKEQAKKIIGSS